MHPKHELSLQKAVDRIAKWLERRELTSHEIQARLERIGYPDELISEALERARSYGWIDDGRAAKRIAEIGVQARLEGRHRIRHRMHTRGIDEPVAEEALNPITPENELKTALVAVRKRKFKRDEFAKAARFLASRGFDEEVIEQVLESEFDLPDSL